MLLHCYPFVREAGWLAHVYANVWFDLSLTIPHVARPAEALREALELAPVSKLLYASDAARTPELYFLAAKWWREALAEVLAEALPPDEARGGRTRDPARQRARALRLDRLVVTRWTHPRRAFALLERVAQHPARRSRASRRHALRPPRRADAASGCRRDRPRRRARGVLLLRRHRFVTDTWGWEIPAGRVDPGETLEEAAGRESIEETGWRPLDLERLGFSHPTNGLMDQRFEYFVASRRGARRRVRAHRDGEHRVVRARATCAR